MTCGITWMLNGTAFKGKKLTIALFMNSVNGSVDGSIDIYRKCCSGDYAILLRIKTFALHNRETRGAGRKTARSTFNSPATLRLLIVVAFATMLSSPCYINLRIHRSRNTLWEVKPVWAYSEYKNYEIKRRLGIIRFGIKSEGYENDTKLFRMKTKAFDV